MKKVKHLLILLFTVGLIPLAMAQQVKVSGKVTNAATGETLPGVTVVVKGTTSGVSTDLDGKYSLNVLPSATLIFSFVGMETREVRIEDRTVINVALSASASMLEEIVVVGYGTSKVKDLTSSITTVKSEDIMRTPSSQPMQALQGKVAGMQVVANGGPGNSSTIRVRGVGSFPGRSSEDPLYVVDGMFFNNIDFLNPSDIATISVLKDASAAAIYGVRAANGVILIETKSGSYNQKTAITYDGYLGYQSAQNIVKMANAEQFTNMALESGSAADISYIDNAMQRYGRSRVNPNIPDVNTDWYNEILRVSQIQNHSLDFSGGNEVARYSIGTNYFSQDGILDMDNSYERLNLRSKLDVKATKWLTIGANLIYSNALKFSEQASAWNLAYFAVPILPKYDEMNTVATPTNYANAQDLGYRSGQNPFPTLDYNIDRMKIRKMIANFYLDVTLIPSTLTFKTNYYNNYNGIDQRVINLPYFIGNSFQNPDPTIARTISLYYNQIWDNVLTFNKNINKHNLTVMAGSSFKDEGSQILKATAKNFPTDQEQSWYINQSLNVLPESVGDDGKREYGMSYFSRLAYIFNNKYLFYATMRADGSNKYQEKWGYFPTLAAGWIISEESFLKGNKNVPYLKLRASWGQLGNDHVPASDGAITSSVATTTLGGTVYSGVVVNNTFNFLKWELTEETNIGITASLMRDRLSADFDYFIRDTKNAALQIKIPGSGDVMWRPVGTIRNSGLELALNWSDKINDQLSYSIGGNISTLKNEARDLYGQEYIDGGSAEFRQRTYLNEPMMAFYGREVAGVYQNQAEIDADPAAVAYNLENPSTKLVPGDFRYKDQNGDGKINDDDRVILGSYFPNFIYGFNLSANYRNFDFSASFYGQSGNKVLNRKRGEIIWTADGNMDADLATNRWHGEGTSNIYPSSEGLRKGWNQKMSDYFVEDGSFFRIQNIQLGYTIKNSKWLGGKFPVTRVAFTADRPLSLFSYNGFTPEVANGIDSQTYPVPATYTVSLNVRF
ncbi:MAG: TonB-dependent receptor [Bacteroidales bacterium]|nr:TonB-dependent receptor [Bacteroidales bacterium]